MLAISKYARFVIVFYNIIFVSNLGKGGRIISIFALRIKYNIYTYSIHIIRVKRPL